MSSAAIEVRDVPMRDGTVDAVRGIEFVGTGEAFRFVGPDGPAKTTTIEMLEGYPARISGDVSVRGVDPAVAPRQRRDRVGLVVPSGAVRPVADRAPMGDAGRRDVTR